MKIRGIEKILDEIINQYDAVYIKSHDAEIFYCRYCGEFLKKEKEEFFETHKSECSISDPYNISEIELLTCLEDC